jgi:hypothetical protein
MTSNRNRPDAVNPDRNVPLRGIADTTKRVPAPPAQSFPHARHSEELKGDEESALFGF